MIRKSIAAAVLAALPLAASAATLELSTTGTGQALYLPYYTVEDDQVTLINISNNTDAGKALRVAFVEGLNGQHVLRFNFYLAPRDSWSAAVFSEGEHVARLLSADASCSSPMIPANGFEMVPFDYINNHPDGGPVGPRMRSGSIEIIETGELSAQLATDCAAINSRWSTGGVWTDTPNADLSAPAGGLSATSHVVNGGAGTVFTLPATAVEGFSATPHQSNDDFPRFSHPVAGSAGYSVRVDGRTLTFPADRGPDAMSALFMRSALLGDFNVEPGLGASTDWLLAFPTKSPYVSNVPGSLVEGDTAVAPFTAFFGADGSCEEVGLQAWSTEGADAAANSGIDLCAQTQLVSFSSQPAAADSDAEVLADKGRARLELTTNRPPLLATENGQTVSLSGLPVVGYRLSRYVNGNVGGGTLANYTEAEQLAREPTTITP